MTCPSCGIPERTHFHVNMVYAGTRRRAHTGRGFTFIHGSGCSGCLNGYKLHPFTHRNGNVIYYLVPPPGGEYELNPKYK